MSGSWMLYATCVALLLAFAATCIESAIRSRNGTTRSLWVVMLVGAICWPLAIAVAGPHAIATVNPFSQPSAPASSVPVSGVTARAPILAPPLPLPAVVTTSPDVDLIARRVALLGSLLVFGVLVVELVRLARARHRWHPELLDGVPVLVSVDFGPAVVGFIRPQIVIPAWALALPAEQRAMMIAHESEHIAGHDNRWLGVAFMAIVLAPWNIGLWWLLNRFRLALEVDCDCRVLLRGHDVEQYGNLLIGIGRHDAGRSLLAAGFAERRTMLRSRIERMTATAGTALGRWRAVAGLALVAAACSLGPSREVQRPTANANAMATADARPAVTAVIPTSVRRLLDRLAPPKAGTPSIVTEFSRDTINVGDSAELVTVTWVPERFLDAARHPPGISPPLVSGLGDANGQLLPIAGGTRMETGAGVALYVSWQTVRTTREGKITTAGAVLSYPGQTTGPILLSPKNQIVSRSAPAVLIVRAVN